MFCLEQRIAAPPEMESVWPWEAERYRLWSLWDMYRFRAASLMAAVNGLTLAFSTIQTANFVGLPSDDESDRAVVRDALKNASPAIDSLPLSRVVRDQFTRLKGAVEKGPGEELPVLIREFHNNLITELSSPYFLMIPDGKREFYEQQKPAFGDDVNEAFPDAWLDIAAASRCLALDEWTACVFHLMRVLEHGLRALAEKVGLPAETMILENWKNIIDQIEKKIRELESQPKSVKKSQDTQELSEIASQFRYFKDAWRNHVSHSRATYDEGVATSVWTHVREFMRHIAKASPT